MSGGLRAVALMGATATGKSALAVEIAAATQSSIICCDSMQLYRGLDIGTAKPSAEERAEINHFLVDCCELPDLYSAARWAEEVRLVIAGENAAGRVPLIVGGTGLYLKALLEGFADIPDEKPEVRKKFEMMHWVEGTEGLYSYLQQHDAVMAERLKAGDSQRIMRALCVLESTGRSLAAWQAEAISEVVAIDCPVFVLDVPREVLRERIASRFQRMIESGWLDEVRWLATLKLADTHPAMRAVGYRQLLDHLKGELTLEKAISDAITATRRYAKRQVTWFNHQTPTAMHGSADQLKEKIMEQLETR
ncbi:tRNA (adenosine(37)-N6)-dimethylallyltransferase MiaA [Mariprofundus sp. KV]|uniref:tRNA (adenosine(37)-N6)-dimethylallyltransferase MiaA n=1 Tax=Mariprofundus sp. KV TaxID=2608715 RepID=UPI0015A0541C|nr:tRNA (adenosine(37)-N6)-dimethylallyltransferase MiaA [Mariprofundus sp. KV]NWF37053.1 tRNA (adenosine(37)-N6)-dimethylallyltransferase MiaA [Mariprofundus sp. KV]